jgi:hypothetical protein
MDKLSDEIMDKFAVETEIEKFMADNNCNKISCITLMRTDYSNQVITLQDNKRFMFESELKDSLALLTGLDRCTVASASVFTQAVEIPKDAKEKVSFMSRTALEFLGGVIIRKKMFLISCVVINSDLLLMNKLNLKDGYSLTDLSELDFDESVLSRIVAKSDFVNIVDKGEEVLS